VRYIVQTEVLTEVNQANPIQRLSLRNRITIQATQGIVILVSHLKDESYRVFNESRHFQVTWNKSQVQTQKNSSSKPSSSED
jgi:hypothetical protein